MHVLTFTVPGLYLVKHQLVFHFKLRTWFTCTQTLAHFLLTLQRITIIRTSAARE